MVMTRASLMRALDTDRIEQAIAAAEGLTSAEIRVSVAPFFWGSVYGNAERAFTRLGMAQTRERNGVLFFIVPARRRFAVLGDEGIHARLGPAFWNELRDTLASSFRTGAFTEGLVQAIGKAGERLAPPFPAHAGQNPDELPNAVDFMGGSDA
jgi:uncharacterized membrane protein